jgi:predicted kinase
MKNIYIFRGSPASGKGTITKEFSRLLPGKVVLLELDTFRWGFHLINRTVADITAEEHELAYRNYLSVLENYLRDGSYTIVTEGLFSWSTPSAHGNMQDILMLGREYSFLCKPILLFADYQILWERNLKREYSVPEDEFNQLHHHVMQEQSEDETRIDVGLLSVDESLEVLKGQL